LRGLSISILLSVGLKWEDGGTTVLFVVTVISSSPNTAFTRGTVVVGGVTAAGEGGANLTFFGLPTFPLPLPFLFYA